MTQEELQRHLCRNREEDQEAITQWLVISDRDASAAKLSDAMNALTTAPVSQRARIRASFITTGIGFAFVTILGLCLFWTWQAGITVGIVYFFGMVMRNLYLVFSQNPEGGRRAALLLAKGNNTEAVEGLADSWQPRPTDTDTYTVRENAEIETELTRLLVYFSEQSSDPDEEHLPPLRSLLRRAVHAWRKSVRRGQEWQLSENRADMLISAVRYIARTGLEQDLKILREIANLPLPHRTTDTANLETVQQTAWHLIAKAETAVRTTVPDSENAAAPRKNRLS
jgi:hypothetical protein